MTNYDEARKKDFLPKCPAFHQLGNLNTSLSFLVSYTLVLYSLWSGEDRIYWNNLQQWALTYSTKETSLHVEWIVHPFLKLISETLVMEKAINWIPQ